MAQPTVTIEQGKLVGKSLSNLDGKPFYGFQGIPYAKPPIGDLRFKAPQPPEPWSGSRDATTEGSECYSRHMLYHNIIGSEDCLFLNVYTQNLGEDLKPVMVWIHSGGFTRGSSKSDLYGPEYLLNEDIVLVTINYRLGILGFLQFEDPTLGVPGNAGLKDVVMALRWVRKNIRSFGGDPSNVTVFGESAGGAAVHHLVLSPLAKGLFHRAISQSGSALNSFAVGEGNLLPEFASILELNDPTEKEVLQHLTSLPIQVLFELSEKITKLLTQSGNSEIELPFIPNIERPSPNAFLSEKPISIIKSGNYNHVPMIFGYTTREGMIMEETIKPRKPSMPDDFEAFISPVLGVERGFDASKNIATKLKRFYYGDKDNVDSFYTIHSDHIFIRDIWFSAYLHAANNNFPVYLYRVSVETRLNIIKKMLGITAPGVCHGDVIGYLFKTQLSPALQRGTLERLSVDRFVQFWTNFAKRGNPNSGQRSDVDWKSVHKDVVNFVDIGKDVTTGVGPDFERIQFWREIYKISPLYSV